MRARPSPPLSTRPRWLQALCALALLAAPHGFAAERYTLAPTPAWVDVATPPPAAPAPEAHSGVVYLLVDRQVSVDSRLERRYYREVRHVLTPAGVQGSSELSIDFDPSFERLVLHHVRIQRDGRSLEALAKGDVRIIQRESGLAERIYDGTLTALVFLRDVRPGDVIDHAYSVEGANPILGGRFDDSFDLAYDVPVRRLRQRLLWPASRELHLRAHAGAPEPAQSRAGDITSYVWDLPDVPAVREEDQLPGWYDPYPWVQASEFGSWPDVARWARELFSVGRGRSPEIERLLERLAREHADDEQRALAAVRFVQDELRYLGIELGPNSHRPHPPAQVLAQRFGDCKDKALLLVALLERLGVEAYPALVNTSVGEGIDAWQPSPFAFDHAVVLARVAGQQLWIDATRSGQGGRLSSLRSLEYRRALVLRPEAAGLEPIPAPELREPSTSVLETYTVNALGSAEIAVETRYSGRDADEMRATLASSSVAELGLRYLNHYSHDFRGIEALRPLAVEDDRDANLLVTSEQYRVPAFWEDGRRELGGWAIEDLLQEPETTLRSMPLGLEHPVHVKQRIVVHLPRASPPDQARGRLEDPAFDFRYETQAEGSVVTLVYTYASRRDAVAADAVHEHLKRVDQVRSQVAYELEQTPATTRRTGPLAFRGPALIALGLLGGLAAALLVAARKRRRSRRMQAAEASGAGDSEPARAPVGGGPGGVP